MKLLTCKKYLISWKNSFSLLLLALPIFFSGCLESFYPNFTEKDLAYDARLLGDWKINTRESVKLSDARENSTLRITNLGREPSIPLPGKVSTIKEKGYLFSQFDKEGKLESRDIVFLSRIGGYLYFDFYAVDFAESKILDPFFALHSLKLHRTIKVNYIHKDGFQQADPSGYFLERKVEENTIRMKYFTAGEGESSRTVFMDATEDFQKFLVKYADTPEFYYDTLSYSRNPINIK